MRYQWKEGGRFPVKAQVAGERLEQIRKRDGMIQPAAVVDDARPDDSPLHCCFEWDDVRAAGLHREEQARKIIRSVYVVHETAGKEEESVVAYIHVSMEDAEPCYRPTAEVMSDEDMRRQALAEALSLLNGVKERFKHLSELKDVYAAIDRATAEMPSAAQKTKKTQKRKTA